MTNPPCHAPTKRADWLLRVSAAGIAAGYLLHWLPTTGIPGMHAFSHAVFDLVNTIWWGVLVGIIMIALLGRIPREFVMSALGTRRGGSGIVRATLAGVLLDLCSHGILMVGAKLYERGATAGQVIAFLVASPWNSFSLTLVLIALIGLPWTLAFIVFSMIIAWITGYAFDRLVAAGVLPGNPNQHDLPADFQFWPAARQQLRAVRPDAAWFATMLMDGIRESRMVVRWILFGILLASVVRALVPEDVFAEFFGPTLIGLGVTVLVATLLEVCSEGSTPVAADILTRAGAPGNSFAFLMGGVATDYTEIMVLKDATGSLRLALFLPLISLPQIIGLAWLMNRLAV